MTVRLVPMSAEDAALSVERSLNWVESVHPGGSARIRFSRGQRVGAVAALVASGSALLVSPVVTLIVGVTVCTVLYLATIAHRALMVRSSLREDPFTKVTDDDARNCPAADLPTYTVLVPAHREPTVMGELITNLESLDYPRHKLQVRLLLEEGDDETIEAALAVDTDLDVWVLVIPPGGPQTKPRALNVGLMWSDGDLVTIYDAEDRPEPLQLRRAAVALARLSDRWACLQARLEFYDTDRNLLTKWFAAEYLTWFTCFLPGLVNRGGVIPLGGTSNHFRRDALVRVGAWDPYNVTEDADLGIRLQCSGYRIGVLDSVTFEEANSDVINWVKQRSRWQKGYLQTAFVHLRQPRRVVRQLGWRGFAHLLLFVAGTPLLGVTNLVFWAISIAYVATQARVIELLFPGPAYYLALFSWAVGNVTIAYLGVITVVRTRRWELIGAVLIAPAYWVLMSVAALRAAIQFVVDPFHWEKTAHGLGGSSVATSEPAPTASVAPGTTVDIRTPGSMATP